MKRKFEPCILSVIMLAALASLALASCEKGLEESDVPYAAPLVDNVLSGIEGRDYATFSRDFSDAMKDAIGAEGFPSVVAKMDDALGKYESRNFLGATKARAKGKDYVIVKYAAIFEKEDKAKITIYIGDADGKKQIEGFMALPHGGMK